MDSLNFTIDGHLGIPGFVRVPPPFGTPRDAVRAIKAAQARMSGKPALGAHPDGMQLPPVPWRQRLTLVAIGVACTVAAALVGSYTGQRRQPLPQIDQAPIAAIAQPPASTVPSVMLPVEAVPAELADDHVATPAEASAIVPATAAPPATTLAENTAEAHPAPVTAQSPAKIDKPRTLARASGRTVAPAAPAYPAISTYEDSQPLESYRAMTDSFPIASGYVAPTQPVRIELQRHTRLTD